MIKLVGQPEINKPIFRGISSCELKILTMGLAVYRCYTGNLNCPGQTKGIKILTFKSRLIKFPSQFLQRLVFIVLLAGDTLIHIFDFINHSC